MDKSLIALILSVLSIIFIIYLFLGFKSNTSRIDDIKIPTIPPTTISQPSGITESRVNTLIDNKISLNNSEIPSLINQTFISDGRNVIRTASYNELGFNIWKGMIVPFYVDFGNDTLINAFEGRGWYMCDGRDSEIPDLRGRFIWGGSRSELNDTQLPSMIDAEDQENINYTEFDESGGEGYHTLSEDEMPRHYHGFLDDHGLAIHNALAPHAAAYRRYISTGGSWAIHKQYWTTDNSDEKGNDKPHNNLPPYRVLAYFIFLPDRVNL